MPIPAPGSEWPPKELAVPYGDMAKWSAWWSGDPDRLSTVYGGSATPAEQSWSERGGLVGVTRNSFQRFFWGQPATGGQQRTRLHVPVAGEVAQVSADLLFGKPPQIVIADRDQTLPQATETQDRLDQLIGEEVHTRLHEAAEACAALGHTYLRVGWDLEVDPDAPIISTVDADAAYPTYRWGRLVEVTFVREFCEANGDILRHFEHHERGMVWHAAYLGTTTNLGRLVPLGEHYSTADLVDSALISDDSRPGSGVETGIDRLDVVAIPNARSVGWRHIPAARDLGRADIAGVESDLDALDDVWSSWMRDIRHGRSRIHVPQHYLETRGVGKGGDFNLDRELYVGLQSLPDDAAMMLNATQFNIRWQEHAESAKALMERITAGAGYSPQTFGLDDATSLTATESWARQVRTQNTRDAKIRRWRPALVELSRIVLDIDRVHFGGTSNPELIPEVHFAETVSESQLAKAQTANLLRAAEAASTETLVRMIHGDWDDEQVQDEVRRILDEKPAAPDPMALFGNHPSDGQPDSEGDPAGGGDDPSADQLVDEQPADTPQVKPAPTPRK